MLETRRLRSVGFGAAAVRKAACLLALITVVWPRDARADNVSLEDAIKGALESHERTKIAALNVEDAEGEVESARADFLPSLTLGAQVGVAPSDDERYVTGSGTLTLRQPLLNPSAIPRLWAAQHGLKAQKLSSSEERRLLAFDTARAFLVTLSADRVVTAAEASLKRATADQTYAEARVAAELNSSNDVTRAKLAVASAARELAQRKRDAAIARLTLSQLVGVTVEGELVSPEGLFADAEVFVGDPEKLSASALGARRDLRAQEEQALVARELAKEPHFRLIPSIDLTGVFKVNPDPLPDQPYHDESLTLSLTWVIFDGGQRYGDRKSLIAKARVAEENLSLTRRTLSTEVRTALVGLDAARDTYALAQAATVASKANTEETRTLYQQGLARAIELVDANAEQLQAEIDAATSKLALGASYLELRYQLGLWPRDGGAR